MSGDYNVAIGPWSLFSNQSNNNVAVGYWSLYNNEVGQNNTAIGTEALRFNNAVGNVATGYRSLYSNTLGTYNSAYGHQALYNNTLGTENTAFGDVSLYTNNTGHQNVAAGRAAMYSNTSGYLNAALGFAALYYNTTGFRNVALGVGALYYNNTGQSNVAIGNDALVYSGSGSFNTGIGRAASPNNGANPSNFTALGYNAGYIGSGSNTMEMGNTSIGWIGGQVGWSTYASDRRVKDNIQSNVPGLTFINRLNPVTYNLNIHRQNEICGIVDTATWEGKYDIEKIVQSGFIAQEVERAAIETNYDFNGYTPPKGNAKMYSMQYSAFVVPLVKAVQELSAENTALKEEIARQSKLINELKDTMEVRFQNLENRLQGQ